MAFGLNLRFIRSGIFLAFLLFIISGNSYYISVPLNSSDYFEMCWMNIDPKDPTLALNSTNPNYVYPVTASFIAGFVTAIQCIGGTILNLLVILALFRSTDLRKEYLTPSIMSIAVTDLMFSIYMMPIMAFTYFTRDNPLTKGCEFYGFSGFGLCICSIFNLVSLAILRCVAVYFPRKTKSLVFQRSCIILPIMTWVSTVLLLLPTLFRQYGRFGLECGSFRCELMNIGTDLMLVTPRQFWAVLLGLNGLLLFPLNAGTYYQVSKQSRRILEQIKDLNLDAGQYGFLEKERKLGKMIALITLSFFGVYSPVMIILMIDENANTKLPVPFLVTQVIFCSLVIIDPMVYIVSHEKYREGIKLLFKPIFLRAREIGDAKDTTIK